MNSSLGPKYETRFMDMRPTFISGYKVGRLELNEKPILFEEDGILILNKGFTFDHRESRFGAEPI